MKKLPPIDHEYLRDVLLRLLSIHSPTGYTDPIVRTVCHEIEALGFDFDLTRRGAIRVNLPGKDSDLHRALVAHLDTLGAMVSNLSEDGRPRIVPVGTWSARFAEGARVSVFTDHTIIRGTILPLKASGHIFNKEVDRQPSNWDNLHIRLDEPCDSRTELEQLGLRVGDFVGVDSVAEILPNGYINARHLDDKAGVAVLLAFLKAFRQTKSKLPVTLHVLFTISEEVGSGASAVLSGNVAEMVSIDNGTCGPGQNSRESGVTVAMADSSGPFDYHLTHHLINLCKGLRLPYQRDIFRYYRCDSASALEAGNDIRTALLAFGVDSSHGYERTHLDSLVSLAQLCLAYSKSPMIDRSKNVLMSNLAAFPSTRKVNLKTLLQQESDSLIQRPPKPKRL